MKILVSLLISFMVISLPMQVRAVTISVSTDTITQFMLVDSNGKRCGYDPATKTEVNDFVSGIYVTMDYTHYLVDDETGPATFSLDGRFEVPDMTPVTFRLVVTGFALGQTALMVSLYETGRGAPPPSQNEVHDISYPILDVGQVATYEMTYTPLKAVTRTKIATSADLIADITTTGKLGLTGNQEFVNELIKKVQKIEKERTHPEEQEEEVKKEKDEEHEPATPAQRAIKKYQKLLKELTEKYQQPEHDEFVKEEAYTVLKEDLEYIIAHIQ